MAKGISERQIMEHLDTLAESLRRISACTAGADEARLREQPSPGEWSAAEILAHLRACADVWSDSVYAMLTLDAPELAYIHPNAWMKTQNYTELNFAENFEAFAVARENLLRILRGLSGDQWQRSATIKGRTHTVFSETRRMALHEREHWEQIEAIFSQ